MHKVINETKGRYEVAILWDSVAEPAQVAQTLTVGSNKSKAVSDAEGKGGTGDDQAWFGAPSPKVLKERLQRGWPEGANRLQQIATRDINPMSIRRRRVRGDQGDEIDMQAVWRGDLSRAWTRTRRMSRSGAVRTLTIVCQLGDSAGVGSDKLFWRGAAALKLADALTSAGYNVGIYGAITSADCDEGSKVSATQFVEIKATDAPLDLSALAALTAMPGFFRTSGFAGISAACDMVGRQVCGSLGRPMIDQTAKYAEMIGITNAYIQPRVDSQAAAEKWIDEVMAKIETPELETA
jgi:hypothetical protein